MYTRVLLLAIFNAFFFSSNALADPSRLLGDLNRINGNRGLVESLQSGNKIFLSRTTDEEGAELWVSDGSPDGTRLVKDIEPGSTGSNPTGFAAAVVDGANGIYFFASTASAGVELWKSDGTEAGTTMVRDIRPGSDSSVGSESSFFIDQIVSIPGTSQAFFTADDGTTGKEPWFTDGSEAGTVLISDIFPGESSSDPDGWSYPGTGSTVYFSATTTALGREPYRATSTTTSLIADIATGSADSDPREFSVVGSDLLFIAEDGDGVQKLWRDTGGAPVEVISVDNSDDYIYGLRATGETEAIFVLLELSFGTGSEFDFNLVSNIFKTDGTSGGTSAFETIDCLVGGELSIFAPQLAPAFTEVDSQYVFVCSNLFASGTTLWVTNGSSGGDESS